MNKYIVPACKEMPIEPDGVICSSFDAQDATEIFIIEFPETLE